MMSKKLEPKVLYTSQIKTAKSYKRKQKKKSKEIALKRFIVMNQNGEFFAGYQRGHFKWSLTYSEAKPLDYIEQFDTIKKHEPLMDIIYDYV